MKGNNIPPSLSLSYIIPWGVYCVCSLFAQDVLGYGTSFLSQDSKQRCETYKEKGQILSLVSDSMCVPIPSLKFEDEIALQEEEALVP